MQITVNGKTRDIGAAATMAELLRQLGLDPARVAVEHNLAIVPQTSFAATSIAEGDTLEIVQFVGGG